MMDERTRTLLIALRRALLMAISAIEDILGIPRTTPPRAERRAAEHRDHTGAEHIRE